MNNILQSEMIKIKVEESHPAFKQRSVARIQKNDCLELSRQILHMPGLEEDSTEHV